MEKIHIRILSLFAIAVMLLILPQTVYSEETQSNYEHAFLSSLGITLPNGTLTRADTAMAAAKTAQMKLEDFSEFPFSDVDFSADYAPYVNALYSSGAVSGVAGSFYPDKPASCLEFTKILLYVMGYGNYCDIIGGYPSGYIKAATSLKLLSGVENIGWYDELTTDVAAVILFNALNTSVYDVEAVGNDSFTLKSGDTMIKAFYGFDFIKGTVTQNQKSTLSSENDNMGKIGIDGILYNQDGSYDRYLGYYVNAYVKEDAIIFMYPDSSNATASYNGSDFKTGDKQKITLEKDDKKSSYTFSDNTTYFYNGVYVGNLDTSAVSLNDLKLAECNYMLLDRDNDKRYDYVFSSNYTYYLTDSTNSDLKIIYDKISKQKLQLTDGDIIKFADGKIAVFSDIKHNDVIAAEIPKNFSNSESRSLPINLTILNRTTYGRVTACDSNNNIIVDGKIIEVNENYIPDTVALMDISGQFFLDINGKVIAYEKIIGDELMKYCYIVAMKEDSNGLGEAKVQLLTKDDDLTVMPLANNATAEKGGIKIAKNDAEIVSIKAEIIGKVVKALIINKEIRKIELSENLAYSSAGSKDKFYRVERREYVTRGKVADDLYWLDPDTIVFKTADTTEDESIFKVTSLKEMKVTEKFTCELYGVDEDCNATVILIKSQSGDSLPIITNSNIFVVKSINPAYANDTDTVCAKGMCGGNLISIIFKKEDLLSTSYDDDYSDAYVRKRKIKACDLAFGDVINYTESEGVVESFRLLLDKSADTDFAFSCGDDVKDGTKWGMVYPFAAKGQIFCYGKVYKNASAFLSFDLDGTLKNAFYKNNANLYIADTTDNTIEKADKYSDEIIPGRRVFLNFISGVERDIVVYK